MLERMQLSKQGPIKSLNLVSEMIGPIPSIKKANLLAKVSLLKHHKSVVRSCSKQNRYVYACSVGSVIWMH